VVIRQKGKIGCRGKSGLRTQNELKQTGLRGVIFVRRHPSAIPKPLSHNNSYPLLLKHPQPTRQLDSSMRAYPKGNKQQTVNLI